MTIFDFEQVILSLKDKYGKTWSPNAIKNTFSYCYLNREDRDTVIQVIKELKISSQRLPTTYKFKKALYIKKRRIERNKPRPHCNMCDNSGLLSVKFYNDFENQEYRLSNSPPPEWYAKLPERSRQETITTAMRCKCGRNKSPYIKGYDVTC